MFYKNSEKDTFQRSRDISPKIRKIIVYLIYIFTIAGVILLAFQLWVPSIFLFILIPYYIYISKFSLIYYLYQYKLYQSNYGIYQSLIKQERLENNLVKEITSYFKLKSGNYKVTLIHGYSFSHVKMSIYRDKGKKMFKLIILPKKAYLKYDQKTIIFNSKYDQTTKFYDDLIIEMNKS
ncbi:hypothetical protein JV173_02135 [Acholeplasma equirhinis]|uniref:hypothetical protein n=1 Tax=Acholeplasma equirhinis TaxID=555393 RepID=UPI00197A7B6D|nr:hypothetical protein [Acholeplasma equirhinis]MBN3490305.1 hypothetical protein [Acholeplasma equirhinis]